MGKVYGSQTYVTHNLKLSREGVFIPDKVEVFFLILFLFSRGLDRWRFPTYGLPLTKRLALFNDSTSEFVVPKLRAPLYPLSLSSVAEASV
jgi:hypothetical protein